LLIGRVKAGVIARNGAGEILLSESFSLEAGQEELSGENMFTIIIKWLIISSIVVLIRQQPKNRFIRGLNSGQAHNRWNPGYDPKVGQSCFAERPWLTFIAGR
jgi:hypothetical protein